LHFIYLCIIIGEEKTIIYNERGEGMGKYLSSHSAISEIAARLKAYRIDYPLSQKELSDKSGVAVRSILRMESGKDIQFGNLIKVLIALGLDANLDMLVPDPTKRPSYYLNDKSMIPQRKRVRKKGPKTPKIDIGWGDEKE
jgi:transcriptional regulator with XRE-family HTH domain